ncbi:ammonia channel protein AmtB [Rhizobium sp. BK226]|uniref:DoxX family protein n=1 Tax=Rhizobium sp. BK226 TaxID=2587075 RepID=UPI001619F31A|nr:DoxX family protein [Rhizobium sp. BK226]MBB4115404.1 ammonia channel protein AmtB [Rhizobium sp. BK226]
MPNTTTVLPAPVGKWLQIGLWAAQVLIFAAFTLFGCMKFFMPVDQLAAMWVWPGDVPVWFLRLMGIIDFAGGVGVLLPALTRIQPRLTVLAALGCALLQIAAMIFHLSRGEAPAVPLNVILLALSAFILWGRGRRAPIAPRR